MSEYVVVHGSIRTGDGFISTKVVDGVLELGLVELSAKEAKKMDPNLGTADACLVLRADYDAEQESKAALAARKKKAKSAPEPEVEGAEAVNPPEAEEEPAAKPVKKSRKKGGG